MSARIHRYPPSALRAAYLLAGTGIVIGFGPFIFGQSATFLRWLLGAMGLLFLVYFARTVVRQLTRIEIDATRIGARGPLGVDIRWNDVRALRLNYYSTRQDRSGGWMELLVKGPRRSIRIESTLEGFVDVVGDAVREVGQRKLELDDRTRANLHALGITA